MSRHEEKTITNIFPTAVTLYSYLVSCINDGSTIMRTGDVDSFKKLLYTSMIVPDSSTLENKFSIPIISDRISIKEALNGIIAKLVRQNQGYRGQNCLAFGYRQKSSSQAASMRSNFDVECYFVNTILPMLSSRVWELLVNRVGEAILYHIFQQPLFVLSKNGCFLQVSGTSTSELVYQLNRESSKLSNRLYSDTAILKKRSLPSATEESNPSPSKLKRTSSIVSIPVAGTMKRMTSTSSTVTLKDGTIGEGESLKIGPSVSASASLPRYKLFYRSYQNQRTGLPYTHILNKVLSGEALVYSVFKNVLHQVKFSHCHLSIHQNLVSLMRTITFSFKSCDVPLLLHLYCPIKTTSETQQQKTPEGDAEAGVPAAIGTPISITLGQQEATPLFIRGNSTSKCSSLKKTRRGCRAGRQVKHRGNSQSTVLGVHDLTSAGLLMTQAETPAFNPHNTAGYYFDDFHYESQELTPEELLLRQQQTQQEQQLVNKNEDLGVVLLTQTTVGIEEGPPLTKTLTTDSLCSKSKRKKLKRLMRKKSVSASDVPMQQVVPPVVADVTQLIDIQGIKKPKPPLHLEEGVNLLSLHSSQDQVSSFVKAVLIRTLPLREVWGTRRNQSVFLSCLTSYIALGRHETITLGLVIQGIRLTDIPWLQMESSGEEAVDSGVSKEDAQLQQQLFLIFVNWLYCDLIHPLLSSCFYITEIDGHKFDCCYYRQPVWSLIVRKGMQQMNSNFSPCEPFADNKDVAPTFPGGGGNSLKRSNTTGSVTSASNGSPTKKIRRLESIGSDSGVVVVGSATDSNVLDAVRRRNYLQRVPRVRFVPKKNSVRALTNLKSNHKGASNNAAALAAGEVLTNGALFNCLHVLKHVYQCNPYAGGFGTFGIDDIYLKFRKYVNTIRQQQVNRQLVIEQSGNDPTCSGSSSVSFSGLTNSPSLTSSKVDLPKFYMAVLDLEKCYDNINKDFLFGIVQKLLLQGQDGNGGANKTSINSLLRSHSTTSSTSAIASTADNAEGAHLIHRYTVSHAVPSLDKTLTKTVRHVSSSEEIVSFQEASEEISRCYRNSIITDGVVYNRVTNQEVLKLLHTHLFSHTVKIPSENSSSTKRSGNGKRSASMDRGTSYQCYRQIKGIPQGSILSPLLCNIYYGHVENDLFNNIFSIEILGLTDRSVIIRLIDDYVMISTDQSCVQHFLQTVHVNLKPYGGGVNPLKTRVNFDTSIEVGGKQIELHNIHSDLMPFCGLFVNTRSLEITPNLGRFFERPIGSSIVVEYSKPGSALRKAIKSYIRTKCDAILLDKSLNQRSTVLTTLYSMYLLAAMRTHNFVNKVRSFSAAMTPSCLYSCITEGLLFGARLLHVRTKRKKSKLLNISSNKEDDDEGFEDQCDPNMLEEDGRSLFERCISTVTPSCFGVCELTLEESLWVGLTAFVKVLSQRKSHYIACIKMLKNKLEQIEGTLKKKYKLPQCQLLSSCEGVLQSVSWL